MSTEKESENKPLDMDVRLKSALSIGDEVKIKRFTTNTVHLGNISKFLEKYVEHDENGIKVEITNGMRGHTIKKLTTDTISKKKLFDLIDEHEGVKFELKGSYFCDINKTKHMESLQNGNYVKTIIFKTMSSLMNRDGGILCIGVLDDKKFYGFENDFRSLFKDKYKKMEFYSMKDKFNKDLEDNVRKYLGKSALTKYDVQFLNFSKEEIENAGFEIDETKNKNDHFYICLIILDKSDKIIFFREHVKGKNTDDEFVDGVMFDAYTRSPFGKIPLDVENLLS
jgi:hypothetical protein